jgi:hypothetical protein
LSDKLAGPTAYKQAGVGAEADLSHVPRSTPEQFAARIREEVPMWKSVTAAAGITLD